MHVAIIAPVTIDRVINARGRTEQLGGVCTYAGAAFARYNLPVSIFTNLRPDHHALLDGFYKAGFQVVVRDSRDTHFFIHYQQGNDRTMALPAIADPISSAHITPALSADWIHLGPLYPTDIAPEAIAALAGFTGGISLDLQGYVRTVDSEHCIVRAVSEQLSGALTIADIVKAERAELQLILTHYQMTIAQLLSVYGIDELVVTEGENGGVVYAVSGDSFPYPACAIDTLVDTTGAGDVFFAAYLVHRRVQGHSIPQACGYAARLAGDQVSGKFIQLTPWHAGDERRVSAGRKNKTRGPRFLHLVGSG